MMILCESRVGWIRMVVALLVFAWALTGCGLGPASISRGRNDYNEVINQTGDEQLLMSIVRNRYGETFNTLAVSSVTASVRIRANAGVTAGFGPTGNYAGNLVPFSGGFAYEENPTISYTPVEGQKYIKQLLSPIPLNLLLLIAPATDHDALTFRVLVSRVNNLRNPLFIKAPAAEPGPQFRRLIELVTELLHAGMLDFVKNPQDDNQYAMVIHDYAPGSTEKVAECLSLLGLPRPGDRKSDVVLPVSLSIGKPDWGGVSIVTRSVYDVLDIMSACIRVPEDHRRSGVARQFPRNSFEGDGLRIHHTGKRPKHAFVAVKYRGFWFYIDETDQRTKMIFRLTRILWSVGITDTSDKTQTAPVLTIPVSR